MTFESPIRSTDGPSSRKSPVAPKANLRNSTSFAVSCTTSRGVMLCQPSGTPFDIGYSSVRPTEPKTQSTTEKVFLKRQASRTLLPGSILEHVKIFDQNS